MVETPEERSGGNGKVLPFRAEERDVKEGQAPAFGAVALPNLPTLEEVLRDWAAAMMLLPELERQLGREDKIKVLRGLGYQSPAKLVDAALSECLAKTNAAVSNAPVADTEPWPEEVRGDELAAEIAAVLRRYVAMSEEALTASVLWVLLAHCFEVFFVLPMLGLSSPVKRSGKTVLLSVIGALVPRALYASNITPAALFRSVEAFRPTLLIDEADTFMRDNPELNGILNSGHTRSSAFVIRTVGDEHEPQRFSTFCPKAYAGIGRQKDTLEDRSIIIAMRRRDPAEQVERLRLDRLSELEPLQRRAARWAADSGVVLALTDPTVPDLGSDRAVDNWRALLAIAEVLGAEWPKRAREAALTLTGSADDEGDVRILLLADLRELFASRAVERLTSAEIVEQLQSLEERPWAEWKGKPITQPQLARLLRAFEIVPKNMRLGRRTPRCYDSSQFEEAFARYLRPQSKTATTCLQNTAFQSETAGPDVVPRKAPTCRDVLPVVDALPWGGDL
jgi:putative DNA primase/helicase